MRMEVIPDALLNSEEGADHVHSDSDIHETELPVEYRMLRQGAEVRGPMRPRRRWDDAAALPALRGGERCAGALRATSGRRQPLASLVNAGEAGTH